MRNKFFSILLFCSMNVCSYQESKELLDIKRCVKESVQDDSPLYCAVVIGGGPAGLNAALYFARAKIPALTFTGDIPGGQITTTTYVENWPGILKIWGYEAVEVLQKQVEHFGGVLVNESISSVDFSTWPRILYTESGKKIRALAVVVATGSSAKKLGVEGEDEYWARGVSKCALCDAPCLQEYGKEPDKRVVVVGGGDTAVEEAVQISAYAKEVIILVRKNRMRAAASMQERLAEYPKISVVYNQDVRKIIGDGKKVTSVVLEDSVTGEITTMPIDALFLAIGNTPRTEIFKGQLDCDRLGHIIIQGRSLETTVRGVFAAGDVEDSKWRQISIALGHGAQAALEAIEFLQDHGYSENVSNDMRKRNRFF